MASITPDIGEVRAGMGLAALGAGEKAASETAKAAARATEVKNNAEGQTAEKTLQGWFDKNAVRPSIDKNVEAGSRKTRADSAEEVSRKIAGRKAADIFADGTPEGMAQRQMLRDGALAALDKVADGEAVRAMIDADPGFLDRTVLALDKHGDILRAVRVARRELLTKYNDRTKSADYTAAELAITAKKAEQDAIDAAISKNSADQRAAKKAIESFTTAGREKSVALKNANADLDTFLTTKIPGVAGRPAVELKALFEHRDTLDQRITALSDYVKDMQALKPPPLPGSPLANSLREAITNRTQLLGDRVLAVNYGTQYDIEKAPVTALENEKLALEGQDRTLKTQSEELKEGKKVLTTQLSEAEAKFVKAREDFEEPYVKDWEDILTTAMEKVYKVNQERQELQKAEIIKELIAKETDPVAKAVYELIDDGRWTKIDEVRMAKVRGALSRNAKFIGDHEVIKFDDIMIKADAGVLINKGEQEFMAPLIEAYISGSNDPEITSITDPKLRAAAIKAKAEEIYKSEKFQNEVVPRVTKELLGRAMQRGLLKPADMRKIEATPEGKRLLEEAKTTHADVIEQQKKAMGFVGSTAEFFKKHPTFTWWLIFTSFFPVLGGGALAAYAGYRTVQGVRGGGGHGGEGSKAETPTPVPVEAAAA